MIQNEDYFIKFMSPIVISNFENHGIKLDLESAKQINNHATNEYLYQFNGHVELSVQRRVKLARLAMFVMC